LKWFNNPLRKAQGYQVIEMTSYAATAREISDTNYLWAHTSHLHALKWASTLFRSKGPSVFVNMVPNAILLAQETTEKP